METNISAGDTAWVLMAAALVFLMCIGLAFFYGGLSRSRYALNTILMTLVCVAGVSVLWLMCGYSLSFAPGNAWLGSLQWWGFKGVGQSPQALYAATVPHVAFAAYQGMFAAITPALISGAVVGRMRFGAFVAFSLLWCLFVYCPVAHWVWGVGGFLRERGALDFAGGTVVHITAGASALVVAAFVGPRASFKQAPLIPHNITLVVLGAGLLWFGWFGFNGGSSLAANGIGALATFNTHIAAAGALFAWWLWERSVTGRWSLVGGATGALVGLVGVTPAAGFVTPFAACLIGILSASVSFFLIQRKHKLKNLRIDDSLDVFACHGAGGIAGALLTGVFARKEINAAGGDGLLAGNFGLLWAQTEAVVVTVVYSILMTMVLMWCLKKVVSLRSDLRAEVDGLDRHIHGEEAYRLESRAGALGEAVFIRQKPQD